MPKVLAQGKTIECDARANLRKVLLHNGIDLYNGGASLINCRGIGSCGNCAVKVEGEVSAANWRDNARRWSVCCQAFSFRKGFPVAKLQGNKTRNAIATSPFSYIKPT
jgi:ferredoxin